MHYTFQEKNGRHHLVSNADTLALLNTFLQTDGTNFDDYIVEAIDHVETSGDTQYFSGNIFALEIRSDLTTLNDTLAYDDTSSTIETPLFCRIFKQWLELRYA